VLVVRLAEGKLSRREGLSPPRFAGPTCLDVSRFLRDLVGATLARRRRGGSIAFETRSSRGSHSDDEKMIANRSCLRDGAEKNGA
jgi:hypothetical protein